MSAPLLQKLYNLAGVLFQGFGRGAAYSEPIVATFSRGIVDLNNDLVISLSQFQQIAALFNNMLAGKTVELSDGLLFVEITGLDLPDDPVGVICQILKASADSPNIGWSVDKTSLSSDGFTIYFDAPIPAGYLLSYIPLYS